MDREAHDDPSEASGSERDSAPPSEGDRSNGGKAAWMRALRDVAPYLDLGWRLAGTAAFPPLLGYGVDLWLGTTPGFLLGGCVVGLAGAVLQLRSLLHDFED